MSEIHFMERALELAQLGLGSVSPNPMVGCVIVHENNIIGEGWHQKYGENHAEVNAINAVKNKGLLPQSTAYVTLEPCSHYGKTPPCADLLIKVGISKVVVSNLDPNPLVNGSGIAKLRKAGIEVEIGLLSKKGKEINKRFFCSKRERRPYVILKWAESADGYISGDNGATIKISGEFAQMYSHKWRTKEDAILIGSQTLINDNPNLTARHWKGRNPVRVILYPNYDGKTSFKALGQSTKTIVFTDNESYEDKNIEFLKISRPEGIINQIMNDLNQRNIQSLLVEGGSRLHQLFIDSNIFDEIRIFKSKKVVLKSGIDSASLPKNLIEVQNIDLESDYLRIFSKEFQP